LIKMKDLNSSKEIMKYSRKGMYNKRRRKKKIEKEKEENK